MNPGLPANKVIDFAREFIHRLEQNSDCIKEQHPTLIWQDYVFHSDTFRRAHVNIVDARDTRGLYLFHCCIFPKLNDTSPIYGLDIIAGETKISGAFHDFSKTIDPNHPMMLWFEKNVENLSWRRPRELPEWAQSIFSTAIIAAGAINSEEEIDQLISFSQTSLDYYLGNVGSSTFPTGDFSIEQNFYCQQQKLNPHNARTMQHLGLTADEADYFVQNVMFPEVK
jgi:Ferredoxin-dependent bilin reductase